MASVEAMAGLCSGDCDAELQRCSSSTIGELSILMSVGRSGLCSRQVGAMCPSHGKSRAADRVDS